MRCTANLARLGLFLALLYLGQTNAEEIRFHYVIEADSKDATKDLSTLALPEFLKINAEMDLSPSKRQSLAWHFRNAAFMAQEFAKKEGLNIARTELPETVNFYKDTGSLAKATGKPQDDRLGLVVARISLSTGNIYLGRATPYDLYMELGKWFFYEHDFKWGTNLSADERHMVLIKKFADYCMSSKHWHEEGGSTKDLR